MLFKCIKLMSFSLIIGTISAFAVTNTYIFKNPRTNQEVLVIGLMHYLGNDTADDMMNGYKRPMAQNLIATLKTFKEINPQDNTVCFYENDADVLASHERVRIQDVAAEEFYQYEKKQKPAYIISYDPRSLWSMAIAGCKKIQSSIPSMTGECLVRNNETLVKIPTINECIDDMSKEEKMISSWPINDDLKKSLLQENAILKENLKKVTKQFDNAKLPHAFFEGKLDKDIIAYDYKLADLGYYAKIMGSKDNIILVLGQEHATSLKKLLNSDGYEIMFETDYMVKANSPITVAVFEDILVKSSADAKQGMTKFLFKTICNTCYKPANEQTQLLKCGRCKKIAYCSVDCQRKDWSEHKKTCVAKQ